MSDTPKIKKKRASKKQKMSFRFDTPEKAESVNSESLLNDIRTKMGNEVKPIDQLNKSVSPIERIVLPAGTDKNKMAFSSYQSTGTSTEEKPFKRMADYEQREISLLDPYISAIISKRCAQATVIGRPSDSKFDKGVRIKDLNSPVREDYQSDKEFKSEVDARQKKMKYYLDWALNCGHHDKKFLNSVFYSTDRMFKFCTLSDYIQAQVRNLLTFGRAGRHTFRDDEDLPLIFRPVMIETIYPLKAGKDSTINSVGESTLPQSVTDSEEFNELEPEVRPHAYVQKVDGVDANFFTESDLKVLYFQKQALFDLREYPLSPIELSVFMVFIHQQTMGYIRNQFIKGLASKSIISIEATDPNYSVDDESLDELRRDFHNYLTRTDNSATTPILAGPFKLNIQSLTPSPKDMEFLQLEDHIIRAMCSAFQISPQEMGYGDLGSSKGGITQSNKEEDIIRGEEAGLRFLLDIVFDDVNEVMCEAFEEFAKNFRLVYVGVGEDTRDSVIQRSTAEIQTTATMNSLYADSDKTENIPFGGDAPLSAAFAQAAIRFMKYSEYRYHFLKDKGALQNLEYDFIIDPQLNQAYMSNKTNPPELQKKMNEQQFQSMTQQMQMQQDQAAQQAQMAQQQQLGAGQDPGQPQEDQEEDQPQPTTLSQAYQGMEKSNKTEDLKKSTQYYFSEWIKLMETED